MNATIDLIDNRKSLRVFQERAIQRSEVDRIIAGAMRAPTAGNMMLYSILEVDRQADKDRLVKTCDNQPFIAKAPLVLIFLADMQRWYDYYAACGVPRFCRENDLSPVGPQESDLMLCSCDALVAAQNAVITAEALGIGSCYIGDIMENIEIHREMFALPPLVFPTIMVCFGYYGDKHRQKPSTVRFPQQSVHFKDHYRRLSPSDFDEMMRERLATQFKAGKFHKNARNLGQHFYLKKTGAAFSAEMRRSVKKALSDWVDHLPESFKNQD